MIMPFSLVLIPFSRQIQSYSVIGDELLNGEIEDCNSNFLCKRLHSFGATVKKISFLPDEIDVISAEVKLFSTSYDHVITAGGLGPTHDDVTVQSIAKAFGETTYIHPDLVELCKEFFSQTTLTENNLKQAYIPESSVLHYNRDPSTNQKLGYPLISVHNVLVFPGVPAMLQKTFYTFDDIFRSKSSSWFQRCVYITNPESENASTITEINNSSKCTIGSYPISGNRFFSHLLAVSRQAFSRFQEIVIHFENYYKNKVIIESNDLNEIYDTLADFKNKFHKDSLIDFEELSVQNAVKHVYGVYERPPNSDDYDNNLRDSIETVETAFDRYGLLRRLCYSARSSSSIYRDPLSPTGPPTHFDGTRGSVEDSVYRSDDVLINSFDRLDKICVAFNGGKDCTALLHLVFAVARKKYERNQIKLRVLYIRSGTEFPEIELFIRDTCERYEIDVVSIQGEIKQGLGELKAKHPDIKAVFMGSRSGDPYSDKLKTFQMTDSTWPEFMRVNPVLFWSYGEVWKFIRSLYLPYCTLYDHGYTSLGCLENTHPNPALQIIDANGLITYEAAFRLADGSKERDGRN